MKKFEIYIDEEFCKGCYFYIEKCPNEILTKSETLGPKGARAHREVQWMQALLEDIPRLYFSKIN